ncbi:MAG: diacylglycerol kinase family lipid kinase [Bacteroidales bacterium]|nr:diacylglycerol kinase family lipid kinase [Bacteroidales bacterium]
MEASNPKKIRFIVNPIAGQHSKESFPKLVENFFDQGNAYYEIHFTHYVGHATELANEAVKENFDLVVAVGGDGTINEVARCLIHSQTVLGIVPSGSGNGLARHLNIPIDMEKALQVIREGHVVQIDTVKINHEVFISIAGVGFDALVAKHFAQDPNRGFFSYFKIVAAHYQRYKPEEYTLVLDNNKTIRTKALIISFANSNQFGYNTTIAPDASLNDGLLDVCIVKKPPLLEMPIIINLLFLKMIDKSKHVTIHKAHTVKLVRSAADVVNLDGEPVMMDENLLAEVDPLSLNVIIPESRDDLNPTEALLESIANTRDKIKDELMKIIS